MVNFQVKKIGRYEVKNVIGKGSMGVVYEAYDPVLEREVAIKTIETNINIEPKEFEIFIERFKREAKAAAKLSHPGIITIYDFGSLDDKTPYIVMELVRGKTLKRYFEENLRFDINTIGNIILQIAKALNYAHKAGIVHRDIKPANIIIQEDFVIKIADFGIAKLPHSELTKTGEILGTPNYMSPEQITGVPADYRADLFSLGVILYQLLTGEKPFVGESFSSLSYKIVYENPVSPKALNPSIPDFYNDITMELLEKDRNKRPSLEEVIKKLESEKVDNVKAAFAYESKDIHQFTTKEIILEELSLQGRVLLYLKQNAKIFIIVIILILMIFISIFLIDNSKESISLPIIKQSEKKENLTISPVQKSLGEDKEQRKEDDLQVNNIKVLQKDDKKREIELSEKNALILIPNVKHIHTLGSCLGTLIFYDEYIEYKTSGKDYRKWKYEQLRGYEYNRLFLIIKTYEKQDYDVVKVANRDFKFKLPNDSKKNEIVLLLRSKFNN